MKSAYKAVKIAVLDTGIRQDLYDYYRDYPGTLEYEDFVVTARLDKDTTSDGTGHGSTAVLLVEKMCPNATYCVARVLKTNIATPTDVDLIVKVRTSPSIPCRPSRPIRPRSTHSTYIANL